MCGYMDTLTFTSFIPRGSSRTNIICTLLFNTTFISVLRSCKLARKSQNWTTVATVLRALRYLLVTLATTDTPFKSRIWVCDYLKEVGFPGVGDMYFRLYHLHNRSFKTHSKPIFCRYENKP